MKTFCNIQIKEKGVLGYVPKQVEVLQSFDLEGRTWVIHETHKGELSWADSDYLFTVSDYKTGALVSKGRTIEEAIQKAKSKIKSNSGFDYVAFEKTHGTVNTGGLQFKLI